jgi:hypothetical protein
VTARCRAQCLFTRVLSPFTVDLLVIRPRFAPQFYGNSRALAVAIKQRVAGLNRSWFFLSRGGFAIAELDRDTKADAQDQEARIGRPAVKLLIPYTDILPGVNARKLFRLVNAALKLLPEILQTLQILLWRFVMALRLHSRRACSMARRQMRIGAMQLVSVSVQCDIAGFGGFDFQSFT